MANGVVRCRVIINPHTLRPSKRAFDRYSCYEMAAVELEPNA